MMFRYVQSENYPAAAPAGMCMYDLNKCDSNICQFRYNDYCAHIDGEGGE